MKDVFQESKSAAKLKPYSWMEREAFLLSVSSGSEIASSYMQYFLLHLKLLDIVTKEISANFLLSTELDRKVFFKAKIYVDALSLRNVYNQFPAKFYKKQARSKTRRGEKEKSSAF